MEEQYRGFQEDLSDAAGIDSLTGVSACELLIQARYSCYGLRALRGHVLLDPPSLPNLNLEARVGLDLFDYFVVAVYQLCYRCATAIETKFS